ncbi:DUF2155 domain-containing protein [Halovulum sp. GXIMD14793]
MKRSLTVAFLLAGAAAMAQDSGEVTPGGLTTGFDREGRPSIVQDGDLVIEYNTEDGYGPGGRTDTDGQQVAEGETPTDAENEEGIVSPPEDYEELQLVDAPKARLRGLDTQNNTVDDFEIKVGQTLAFKRLEVKLEACRYPAGDLAGEAYAFLRIRDFRQEKPSFEGWMLSTSPALSALDHPRYDVWVLSCNTDG